jgi:hypothetical protein
MAGQKKKKPKQPPKKKHPPKKPPPGTNVLSWEVSQGNTPVSVPTPDPAEKPLAFRSPHPRASGRAVSARHGFVSLPGGGRSSTPIVVRRRFAAF